MFKFPYFQGITPQTRIIETVIQNGLSRHCYGLGKQFVFSGTVFYHYNAFFRKDIALKNKNKTTFDLHSENIATYKPATQSTTHHRSDNADKAVDGNKGRSVSLDGEFCSNTKMSGQTIAWWQVDLQNNYTVHGISITPKMKGKRFWLRPTAYTSFFWVWIYNFTRQ